MHKSYLFRVLFFLLLISISSANAGVFPVGQPEFDFIYDRAERNEALTFDYFDYQLGPYSMESADINLGPFRRWRAIPHDKLEVFGFLTEDFRSSKDNRAIGYETLRGGVVARPVDRMFVYGAFKLDEQLAKDPNYTGKKWRGLAGDVDQAFITYKLGKLEMIGGRFASFWGPRNSLTLAPNQKLDGFGYTFRWGRLAVSYRLGGLDGLNPDEDTVSQYVNRYVAAHRVDVHLAKNLRLGAFETVVFGGPGRQIDLFYLNPLIFFHGTQLNEGTNDNTLVGLDFSYKPFVGYNLYGQVLLDDIQFDNKTASDQEPDQFGVILGLYAADLMRDLDVRVEYSIVTNWTFNQMHDRNRFTNDGTPIGGALGNDYDLLKLSVIRWWNYRLKSSLGLSLYRQGEGRIDADWTSPWTAEGASDYAEPFPTGTVQKTTALSAGLNGFVTDFAFVDLTAGVQWVKNGGHIESDTESLPFLNLRLSAFFGTAIDVD